jgi:PncC family amidohydrolase
VSQANETQGTARAEPQRIEIDRAHVGADTDKLFRLPKRDIAIRFGFGAAVSVASGIVGLGLGLRAGGMLLSFPAILPAALTLIEKREGTSEAISDVRGAVVGALALVGFAGTVVALATRIPTGLALVCAAAGWGVAAIGLYVVGQKLALILGEQHYLPDVGVVEAQPVVAELRRAGLRIAVAESESGGVLAALLAAAAGGPEALAGGVVAVSADSKRRLLDVDPLLSARGSVSELVALAMADGAQRRLGGEAVVAIAGPADGGPEPGQTWVVASGPHAMRIAHLFGDRGPEANRGDAVRTALRLCSQVVKAPS